MRTIHILLFLVCLCLCFFFFFFFFFFVVNKYRKPLLRLLSVLGGDTSCFAFFRSAVIVLCFCLAMPKIVLSILIVHQLGVFKRQKI